MSNQLKTSLIKCLITTAIGGTLAAYYILSRDFGNLELVEKYRVLVDGISLPGMFMIFMAALFSMNNLGALDSITYLVKYGVRALLPGVFGEMEHYLDYVEERRQKRVKGYKFLYVVGIAFIGVSLIFLVLFYSVFER